MFVAVEFQTQTLGGLIRVPNFKKWEFVSVVVMDRSMTFCISSTTAPVAKCDTFGAVPSRDSHIFILSQHLLIQLIPTSKVEPIPEMVISFNGFFNHSLPLARP